MVMSSKIFKYASLLLAAVMLVSCTGTVDPEDANNGTDTGIEGGNDNGNDNGSDEGNDEPLVPKELILSVNKNFVQTFGGDYIQLTVELGDMTLCDPETVTFYDESDNVITIENFRFRTEKSGEQKFYANYGTYFSNEVTVTGIDVPIPTLPEDYYQDNLSFMPRVLLTQFTTTGCTYCPLMKKRLKEALDEEYTKKVVKVDCHNGIINKRNDPAYVHLPDFGDGNYPKVYFDMYLEGHNNNLQSSSDVHAIIDELYDYKEGRAVGIAVASNASEDQIVTNVLVKAAEEGQYRIGVMLLEDNIVASAAQTQQGTGVEDWMNTHNSCIRYMDAGSKYLGHSLGTLKKGETADYVFVFNLTDIWDKGMLKAEQNYSTWAKTWVAENLHLAIFVTTTTEDGYSSYVSNVVDCSINETRPFEFTNI